MISYDYDNNCDAHSPYEGGDCMRIMKLEQMEKDIQQPYIEVWNGCSCLFVGASVQRVFSNSEVINRQTSFPR